MGDGEMPKEMIHTNTGARFGVEVRWGRDSGDIQIATVMGEPLTSEEPQNLVELVATWKDTIHGRGLFADLNRQQINRLIRVLRTARDQALGKDE